MVEMAVVMVASSMKVTAMKATTCVDRSDKGQRTHEHETDDLLHD
jgi:hypothetical protein